MLTEKIHAILQSGVKTLSFSVDAADEKSYSKFRVNGNAEKNLKILNYLMKFVRKFYLQK